MVIYFQLTRLYPQGAILNSHFAPLSRGCEWHNKREKFRLIKMENFQPVPLVNWEIVNREVK